MPGITQRINDSTSADSNDTDCNYQNQLVGNGMLPHHSFHGSSVSSNGFWSNQRDDVSFNQLQTFWCDLTLQARQKLLRIDKQTLFEHARKNMYCSRCNGLLLEGFLQIVMYGKSPQQNAAGHYGVRDTDTPNDGDLCIDNGCQNNVLDPSVHPWGGLTTVRDGTLTLLDCYVCSKSLKGLQNVFDSARAREKERKLLYPDACGGGGRGWISQGMSGHGRGHGTREACALHTARLPVETLVDFWSALGEETRQSLLRMKEEDFIERLMYRFDSKRFCRDCRRNVIREFKELKELKRMRRETRCTSWFCVADTAFQYEVSRDTVQADWNQTFLDALGSYHHFEWAIGTGEGKYDIMEFEDVGLSGKVEVSGLDLSGLSACYITLRAWKIDGRCNELCVKAHALQGQQCVHHRLVVGDGYLTITRGESIRSFFEHAEEAEEEEDDDSLDKDGNELDGECSRPQKHAKSPELAREFLLDAATVIFKEQVEKAFREGTARQNAHSIFVFLALKLLEERLNVACKEIITLEKQMKLLEEEEKEKREEEERKERRRIKEREKKLRRKERLREKDNKDKKCAESNLDVSKDTHCDNNAASLEGSRDFVSETGEVSPASPFSLDIQDDKLLTKDFYLSMKNLSEDNPDGEFVNTRDWHTSYPHDHFTYCRRKLCKEPRQGLNLKWSDGNKDASLSENGVAVSKYESRFQADSLECTRNINGFNKQLKTNAAKFHFRNGAPKFSEKCQCTNNKTGDRYDFHVCSCNHHNEYRPRSESHNTRVVREPRNDVLKPYYRGRYSQVDFTRETYRRPKSKGISGNSPNIKQVWEPLDSQKKYVQSNSSSDVKSTIKTETSESDQLPESSDATNSDEVIHILVQANHDSDLIDITRSSSGNCRGTTKEFHAMTESKIYLEAVAEDGELSSMTKSPHETLYSSMSSSDNCSSCVSEGDSHTSSSNLPNVGSSSTSDSEESTQNSDGKETSNFVENKFTDCSTVVEDENTREQDNKTHGPAPARTNFPSEVAPHCESGRANVGIGGQPLSMLPQMHNQSIHYPVFQAPTMGYYHQNPISWPAGPTNGLVSFPNPNHYLYANTFGYDLNGNALFMQYGTLQHMAVPLLNPAHMPVFPHVSQANGVSAKEPAKFANLGEVKEVQRKTDVASMEQQGKNGKSGKMDMGNNGFSLFHFGGPVALSDGLKPDSISLKKGTTGDASLCLPGNRPDGNRSCNMKDSIEEYNLFAAGNGIKFSFF